MKHLRYLLGMALVILVVLGEIAYADTIGPSNCDSCHGASYTLTSDFVDLDPSSTVTKMDFTLTIDTAGVPVTGGAFLTDAGIKITTAAGFISGALIAPSPSGFTEIPGGVNSGGCNGTLAGFDCAHNAAGVATGGIFVFHFEETFTEGTLLTGPTAASVKARYADATGDFSGPLTSEGITIQDSIVPEQPSTVPEPASLLLLGSGLAGLGLWRWKKG